MPLDSVPPSAVRLLLVEDEESISGPVRRGLEEEGYAVSVEPDGARGLAEALSGDHDALIVDWRLPHIDGRTLVEQFRGAGRTAPVLMLTALSGVEHRVAGLDAGADDYLPKPFAFEELLARLRALLRRAAETPGGDGAAGLQTGELRVGRVRFDASWRRAVVEGEGEPVDLGLRDKELRLLELLMRHAGEAVSRTRLAERVWGSAFEVTDNAIDQTASGLRLKLSDAGASVPHGTGVVLETVRGVGYRLVAT
ncbi:response regulator transcription factor [Rubrivirga sp. S365]|uniref:response regulator transcription factor n=1 Tax=Rubrivirga sp. S365 TaxID=3076080 RepID=UPI0028C5B3B4|nr:response regulator transcription factor [Rubrivirga sp. S365]MDT7858088.1 response regulator transcription factor [Rubrivirga sp. S365]